MEIPKRLIDCLKENKVHYEVLHHPEAVTAQRIAQAEHVKGRHHAKVVMIKSGEQHLMMVLPADHQIDLDKHLAEQDYIVFEAGTHTDAIKMSYRDYEKIVKPKMENLAVKLQPMKGA